MENTPDIANCAPPVSSCWPKPQNLLLAAVAVALVAAGVFLILSGVGVIPGIAALGIAGIISGSLLSSAGGLTLLFLLAHRWLKLSNPTPPPVTTGPNPISASSTPPLGPDENNTQSMGSSGSENSLNPTPPDLNNLTAPENSNTNAKPAALFQQPLLNPCPPQKELEAHGRAKEHLKNNLAMVHTLVSFVSPDPRDSDLALTPTQLDVCKNLQKGTDVPKETLDAAFGKLTDAFSLEFTYGVREDILTAGQDRSTVQIFSAASQFNGAESTSPTLVPQGEAFFFYQSDLTQGPQAQLAGPEEKGTDGKLHRQVEIINDSAHIGYNALINLLTEETKAAVRGGYLMPVGEELISVVNALKQYYTQMESIALEFIPHDYTKATWHQKTSHPVHLILSAAPALSDMYYNTRSQQSADFNSNEIIELQYLCALLAFRTQFKYVLEVAKQNPDKQILFKPCLVGGGVFRNNPKIIACAFRSAGTEYESLLKSNVSILFQLYKRSENAPLDEAATSFATTAGLPITS